MARGRSGRADFTTNPAQCQFFFQKIFHKNFPSFPEIIVQFYPLDNSRFMWYNVGGRIAL